MPKHTHSTPHCNQSRSVLTYAAHFRVEQLPGQLEELLEVGQRVQLVLLGMYKNIGQEYGL
jgi:hypothetical protein